MAKRPKWLDHAARKVPTHLHNIQMSGEGTSDAMRDVAFWLGDDTRAIDPWVTAFEAIDRRSDKEPLLELLKSTCDMPHVARVFLADLLERYQLKGKRGGQSTPAYDRSEVDRVLELGNARANVYIERGMTVEEACEKAGQEYGIPDNFLIAFRTGKRGSSARMKKRRP